MDRRRRTDNTMAKKKKYKRTNKDLQNITHKTKDRVTRTPLKTGVELRCSGRVGSSCSTSDVRRVNLVTNPVISHEWGKGREVCTTSGTYPWSFVTQIFQNDNGGDRKTFDLILIDLIYCAWRHFQQCFSYIMTTSFSGGRRRSTRREPPTMGKQPVNFITCGCESSTPFFVIYKAGCEPTLYWW